MPTVSVNPPKTPVTKGSSGIAAATVPNVCKMPGPPAPFVPTPLPNIGNSGSSPTGYSVQVKIEGQPVAIQGASFGSTGDIAAQGTGGGIVSANVQGPTKFIGPGSFDVKIEGKNVQLLGDPMLNNCGPSGAPANAATMAGVIQPPAPAAPAPPATAPAAVTKYNILAATMTVNGLAPGDIMFVNDPDAKFEVDLVATYAETHDGTGQDALPTTFKLSFTEPPPGNTRKADSFEYAPGKFLGKKDDASAILWAAHAASAASSDDSFNRTVKVTVANVAAQKKLTARVYFKPSGVGGDAFELKAALLAASGGAELVTSESNALVVWRKVTFDKIIEMQGKTHVSTNAQTALIAPVYVPAFVEYTAGPRTELAANLSAKYIGLWKDTTTPQQSWATVQQKTAAETPTPAEIAEATYTGAVAAEVAKIAPAQAAIKAKAQAWVNRIDAALAAAESKWFADAAIPANALVGVEHYHPKYSLGGGDFQTHEWNLGGASTPAWLRVTAFYGNYTGLDPDSSWIPGGGTWGGMSHGNGIVTAPVGPPAATLKQVVRHEAGHATKSFFKRDVFGPSLDHSASNAGIMYYATNGGTTFTDREKKILRGITP